MSRWELWTAGLLIALGILGWGGLQSSDPAVAKSLDTASATPLASPTPPKRPVISAENVDQLELVGHIGRGGAYQAVWAEGGQYLVVTSKTGIWWHDMNHLDTPPQQLGTYGSKADIAASADGKFLAWPHDWFGTVWNTVTGKAQVEISVGEKPDQTGMNGAIVSADGSVVIFSDSFDSLYVVNTHTDAYFEVRNRVIVSQITETALSPDGSLLAIVDTFKGLFLFRTDTPEFAPVEMGLPKQDATSVSLNWDGTQLAVGYKNGALWVQNVATRRLVRQLKEQGAPVVALAFSPDSSQLLAVHEGGLAELWDMRTGVLRLSISCAERWGERAAFSPDGNFILITSAYDDSQVSQVWNAATGQVQVTLEGAANAVFSPDGKMLAAAYRGTIGLWDVETGQLLHTVPGYDVRVVAALSPDGQLAATVDPYGQVSVRAVDTGQGSAHWQLPVESSGVVMSFGVDNNTLIIGGGDGQVRLWDIPTRRVTRTFVTHTIVREVALNRDGQWPAAACYGGLFVWNAVTGERLWVASDSYSSVSFGGGGKLLAALTEQGSGQIWDVATHTLSSTLPVFVPQQYCEYCGTRGIAFFAFMPDGKTLAYSADSQTIKLRDAQTGYNYPQSTFCDGDLLSVTFSADSKLIGMACMGSHDYSFGQLEAFTPNGAESIGSYGGTFGMLERDYIGELLFDPNGTYLLVDRLWLFGVVSQRTER